MINFYKTIDGKLEILQEIENGCWINVVDPTSDEISELCEKYGFEKDFIMSALDEEETSHIDKEDDQTFIISDVPYVQNEGENIYYSTIPLGIIVSSQHILTISLKETVIIREIIEGSIKNINTSFKTQFVLYLQLKIASKYLLYLKQIDRLSKYVEKKLHQSMRNKELIQLLDLRKSLVFFSTSLKANEATLEKMMRGRVIKLYEEDQDLLEDVLIEVKQAIEMSTIYSNVLSGTMDAFASIISNNLNIVMKVLTSITILMAIPTMIASFYGMNVKDLPLPYTWFPLAFAGVVTLIVGIILWKKGMFK
ncbi:MAG: magnesium transporter CorA family protein [Clostridia bacterium]|nr:magnesium transporter CorA family protein [Clostridia bacterium]